MRHLAAEVIDPCLEAGTIEQKVNCEKNKLKEAVGYVQNSGGYRV